MKAWCGRAEDVGEKGMVALGMDAGRVYVVSAVAVPDGYSVAFGDALKDCLPKGSLEFWQGRFVPVNGGEKAWPLADGLYLVPDVGEAVEAKRLLGQLERRAS